MRNYCSKIYKMTIKFDMLNYLDKEAIFFSQHLVHSDE